MSEKEMNVNSEENLENEANQTEQACQKEEQEKDCCKEGDKKDCCKDKDGDKKDKKKKCKKEKLAQEVEELTDKYQRLFAEFQNYRKRSENEKSAMYTMGASDIIEKMLPIMDNLERGVTTLSEEDLKSPTGEGLNMIYKQMQSVLEDLGVKEIEAEGCEFNPDYHNAVMHEDNDELGENTVSMVLQKGYTYNEKVIRHSMVKVAN